MPIDIPLEIRLKEKKEINEQIRKLEDAEKTFRTSFQKGASKDNQSSQAVPTLEDLVDRDVLPSKKTVKNKTTQSPVQFKKQKVVTRESLDKILNDRIGKAESAFNILSGRGGGPLGFLTGFATKLAPPMAAALVAVGFIETIIKTVFGPGGPFDKRLNEFAERTNKLFSTRDAAQKRQGFKTVRITSYYGSRGGQSTTYSTLDPLRRGEYSYSRDLKALSQGVIN